MNIPTNAGDYIYHLMDHIYFNTMPSYWAHFTCTLCGEYRKWSRYHIISHYTDHFTAYHDYLCNRPHVKDKYQHRDFYPVSSYDMYNKVILDSKFYAFMKKQYLTGSLMNVSIDKVDPDFLS